MEFQRFNDYWGQKTIVDDMIIRVVPDATSPIIELETGSVDIISNLQIIRLEQKNKNLQIDYKSQHGH